MKNLKLKTNVKFSISKSENVSDLKFDFKIPTQQTVEATINNLQDSLNSLSVIKKPIIKKPLFSSTINTNKINELFKPPVNIIKNLNLKVENLNNTQLEEDLRNLKSEEEYDTSLPRTEIVSLTDFYPLYDNNLKLTEAGNHFRYQLLYLNANRYIINNDIKKYFSQSNKDESLKEELQTLLKLVNDKNYQNFSFDLYTNEYFDKLISISDYSISQVLNFYSKIDNINKFFIEKSKPISLLQNIINTPSTSSIQKLYGILFLLLEQKISLYSKKISKDQNTADNNKIAINFQDEEDFNNFSNPNDFINLKINESKFQLKILFENKNEEKRIKNILDFIVYESYKNSNKQYISLELNKNNIFIDSKNLSFKNEDFTKGKLLSLLTRYPTIINDTKERFLYSDLESDTYISNVFQNIISTNFSQQSIELIGHEINLNNDVKSERSKIFNKINDVSNIRNYSNSIQRSETNQPPYINLLLRNISKNLKNYNFEIYTKNLQSTIDELKKLVEFYYKQVETCKNAPPTTWPEINGHPSGQWNHVIGDINGNDSLIKNISDALCFINLDWESRKWSSESKVSKYYVPYGDGNEDVANFIGFLTYLFKRTSIYPGQYSRDNDPKYYRIRTDSNNQFASIIDHDITNLSQSYWLTFNELIKTINDPENEFSSNKNPFYKKFSETYINILKNLGITNLNYNDYSYEAIINVNNEQIFIMFNVFIFLADNIKSLFQFEATTHWFSKWTEDNTFSDNEDHYDNFITKHKNNIGVGGVGTGPNGLIVFKDNQTNEFIYERWEHNSSLEQHFNALDIKFDIENQIIDFNTKSATWLNEFNQIKEIHSFINNQINNINLSINEILSIDYDVLRFFIDPKFKLNKRNFFMTRFQLNDLKEKYNKIKNNEINYLIDDIYDDRYESNIRKVLLDFKDSSKNAKILTFGIPNNIEDAKEINVTIYRKNLIHENLNFKPIVKIFDLNLFCSLTNFYEKNDLNSVLDYLKNSGFYHHKNDLNFNKLTNQEVLNLNREIITNHFYSEILNQYIKIMSGIEINDFTMINDYPVVNSEDVLTNISNIIFNDQEKSNGNDERLLNIKNNITKFISPIEFRSFLFSSCIFERVFSTLIDPDDFEIDTENWVKKGLIPQFSIELSNLSPDQNLNYIIDGVSVILKNGKFYLNDVENIADSYKIKIDKFIK